MPAGKKYGGRKKGTPNKSTQSVREMADRIGVDPLEILLMVAANDWEGLGFDTDVTHFEKAEGDGSVIGEKPRISLDQRIQAAKEAAKYLHAQRKALEHSGEVDLGLIEEAKRIAEMSDAELKAIAKGKK